MKILNSDCVEYVSYDSEEEFEKDSTLRKTEGWKVLSVKYPSSPKIIKWVKTYEADNNSLSEAEKFCVRGIKLEKMNNNNMSESDWHSSWADSKE